MTTTPEPTRRKPLRLWPGVVAAAILVVMRYLVPLIAPQASVYGMLAALAGAAAIVLWWTFFSRAPWSERILALAVIALAAAATKFIVHPSIAGGFMGMMLLVYCIPITLGPAFVAWAVLTRHRPDGVRRATMIATILLACGVWAFARTDGVKGEAGAQLAWRWTPTPEERLLAQVEDEPPPIAAAPAAPDVPKEPAAAKPVDKLAAPDAAPAVKEAPTPAAPPPLVTRIPEWPGFRGRERNAVIRNLRIDTDWSSKPPAALWRRPIGPGWSSFAVDGDRFYTQEQRGEEELVSCYRLSTGVPLWRHRDRVRFYESNGGPGPRATPTLHNGRLYTFGATGIVNALDAATGARIWTRNAGDDTGATIPGWGFTSSPLPVGDAVIVAASGRLVAYDMATGNPRWTRKTLGGGYSSPHLVTIDGVPQIVLLSGGGATAVAPADGAVLWEHAGPDAVGIVQPALADGGVLIASGDAMGGLGIRRLAIARGPSGWKVEERWASRGLKPYFNDFVVHNGHAFGFDGSILSCIDLNDGARKWKGGRYGQGQLVLLRDQDVLLILSEDGELALVSATADGYKELARVPAIEGKTWNHPVVIGDVLLVRNGEQMAAFRLARASEQ